MRRAGKFTFNIEISSQIQIQFKSINLLNTFVKNWENLVGFGILKIFV